MQGRTSGDGPVTAPGYPSATGTRDGENRMATTGFDIRSLIDFKPATFRCERCLALLHRDKWMEWWEDSRCPHCDVEYMTSTREYVDRYLRREGLETQFDDLTGHARLLARLGMLPSTPPIRLLNQALGRAAAFVHFISWGIDPQMIGALKLASERVKVYGVVSNASANIRAELTEYTRTEAPHLQVRCYPAHSTWEAPHQKLVVIDGLLAFTGSANLTVTGWRKSADGRDLLEVVTDVDRVRDLNNRYFSPIWQQLSPDTGPIVIDYADVPF